LRSWLSTESASTAPTTPDSAPKIAFTIGPGAVAAREALCLPAPAKPRRKKPKDGVVALEDVKEKDINKLDDITDCCLQAAAWVAWESNRLQLWDVWDKSRGNDGQLPELTEEILKDMIQVAGEN
jgi:cruciform cutting endonuclease 1